MDGRPARLPRALLAACIALTAMLTKPAAAQADGVHEINYFVEEAGPLGSVSFIGDSVGIGAGRYSPSLTDELADRGWGPMRFHAVDGKRTGLPPGWPDYFNAVPMIDEWQAEGWDSDTWIINLGANDTGFCRADVSCAREAIMLVVDAIGPGHRIWWPKVTRFYTHQYQADAWNVALDQIAAERFDFWTWDWPAEMWANPEAYGSWDGTHLFPDGYRNRNRAMAQAFTDALGPSRQVAGHVVLPPSVGVASAMVPVAPVRVIDTRVDEPGRLSGGERLRVDLSEYVPDDATAAAVGLTAVGPSGPGFLAATGCGDEVTTSVINHTTTTRAGSTIVPLDTDASFCVFVRTESDVIVDLQAVLVPAAAHPEANRLTPLDTPRRLLDSRSTGRSDIHQIDVPGGTVLASINLTVTGAGRPGFARAYPCGGELPDVSNVNFVAGDTVASAAFIPVGESGRICVATSTEADVLVDLNATLAADGDAVLIPVAPTRLLDTRRAVGGWAPHHAPGATLSVSAAPAHALAVTGTLTMVQPYGPSFLSATPCGDAAQTSSVNGATGSVAANAITVGLSDGVMCVHSRAGGHTLFDVTGWWVSTNR